MSPKKPTEAYVQNVGPNAPNPPRGPESLTDAELKTMLEAVTAEKARRDKLAEEAKKRAEQERGERLRAFLEAHPEAMEFFMSNTQERLKEMLNEYPGDLVQILTLQISS